VPAVETTALRKEDCGRLARGHRGVPPRWLDRSDSSKSLNRHSIRNMKTVMRSKCHQPDEKPRHDHSSSEPTHAIAHVTIDAAPSPVGRRDFASSGLRGVPDVMAVKSDRRELKPEAELRSYMGRLDPKNQKLIRSVRAGVCKRFPTANELLYDYNHFFVIGYSPTDRGIDSIVAIAARVTGVFLYFSQGPRLHDPKRILLGSGKQTRFIQVEAASQLAHPDVEAFIADTIEQARIPLPLEGKGSLIIKSSAAAKKRPRRRPAK